MSIYAFNYARFQEPEWVNGKGDERLTREECYRDIKKLAQQFAPQMQSAFTQMFRKYGADDAALTGNNKFSFTDILEEVLGEAAYEAINEFIPEDV